MKAEEGIIFSTAMERNTLPKKKRGPLPLEKKKGKNSPDIGRGKEFLRSQIGGGKIERP